MNVSYIAGLFDGEGCIYVARVRHFLRFDVSIANTNEQVLQELKTFLGYGTIHQRHDKRYPKHLPVYRWIIHHRVDVHKFLTLLLPHLIIKKEKAERMLLEIKNHEYPNSLRNVSTEALKKYRKHMTMREMAKVFGVSPSTICENLAKVS